MTSPYIQPGGEVVAEYLQVLGFQPTPLLAYILASMGGLTSTTHVAPALSSSSTSSPSSYLLPYTFSLLPSLENLHIVLV